MTDLPRAIAIARAGSWTGAADRVVLDYEGRFLRRKRLVAAAGLEFLADLPETASLDEGDALVLEDGRRIEVAAADEPLYRISGDLARLAWHIGNRHTPCAIGPSGLTIRRDHVLRRMLEGLGAAVSEDTGPFLPEGGAYGQGRTMGHDHGHRHNADADADYGHDHDHGHGHGHEHGHGHGPARGHAGAAVSHHGFRHHLSDEDPPSPEDQA
jgi:urease accessory protein